MVNPLHPKLERFGDKHRDFYKFGHYLVDEGDFIITEAVTDKQRDRFMRDVYWWSSRNNKVVKVETTYVFPEGNLPGGKAVKVTLLRNYRYIKPK